MSGLRVTAISGFRGKGPACFLVETGDARLILDCGKGPDRGRLPDLARIGPLDAVLISHGHADHIGGLDLVPDGVPVHATAPVIAIGGHPRLAQARTLPLSGETTIAGLAVETGQTSHAPGGVWLRIGGEGGVLYSGDHTRASRLYPWQPFPRARAFVLDASYGAYDRPNAQAEAELRALVAEGRPVLFPVPADGRAMEMALAFADIAPVRLDAAVRRVAEIVIAQEIGPAPMRAAVANLLARTPPLAADGAPGGVMLAASANADSGTAADLLTRIEDDDAVAIVFTGHLAEGAPSERLVESGRARFVRWNVHPTLAELAAALDEAKPEIVMPAFVKPPGLADLAAALPQIRFATEPTITLDPSP